MRLDEISRRRRAAVKRELKYEKVTCVWFISIKSFTQKLHQAIFCMQAEPRHPHSFNPLMASWSRAEMREINDKNRGEELCLFQESERMVGRGRWTSAVIKVYIHSFPERTLFGNVPDIYISAV